MKRTSFPTPILFLIFNRPETTERVFQQIRALRPRSLFISADGPRAQKSGEDQKCAETRRIIEQIDWPCAVKKNFSDVNMGCKKAVSSGIDWFFSHVEEGIILEDDCLPDPSFFHFCQSMLDYYRGQPNIMHIGGTNFQDGRQIGTGSYYFSTLTHVWGWATWKRAWKTFDVDMKSYPACLLDGDFQKIFPDPVIRKYWKRNFDLVYAQKKDTWDLQWQYATSFHRGLAVIPNMNLITNIGFDQNATHTVDFSHSMANKPMGTLTTIVHPSMIRVEHEADLYTVKKYLSPPKWKKVWFVMLRCFEVITQKQ